MLNMQNARSARRFALGAAARRHRARCFAVGASPGAGDDPHRAADQDLLSHHHLRDGAAPGAVRQGRHQGRADDLSQRRRDLRGGGGGRRRPAAQLGGADRGRAQEGRDDQGRRRRRARLLRLVPDGEDGLQDQPGRRAGGQEGRHHRGRLRLRPAGLVDDAEPQDEVHQRSARRRRPGAEPAVGQCRCRRALLAAVLQDDAGEAGPHPDRLRQRGRGARERTVDRHRQVHRREAGGAAEGAQRHLRGGRVPEDRTAPRPSS